MEIRSGPVMRAGTSRGFADGVAVTGAKGFVFLSGVTGLVYETGEVPLGLEAQARNAWRTIIKRLEKYGSSVEFICHAFTFVVGAFPHGVLNDSRAAEIKKARLEVWRERYGAEFAERTIVPSTLIGVTALGRPEMLLEIRVTAAIP